MTSPELYVSLWFVYLQSEAVVNAGPAVFINQSGPNPLMVQVIIQTSLQIPFVFHLFILL